MILDTLLTDADVTFADGDSLAFVCDDGPYTKFNPTYKDITEGKYSFKDGKGEEVPAAIALVWGIGAAADSTVADIAKTAKDTGSCASSAARPRPTSRLRRPPASAADPASLS